MTSAARTQPTEPCWRRTMYQISLPTDSAIGVRASPFSKVAIRSLSTSCREYKPAPDSRAVIAGAESAVKTRLGVATSIEISHRNDPRRVQRVFMRFLLYRRRSLKSPLILAYLAIASKALIEAKILQRYAMISAHAASVEEPPNYIFIR